MLMPVMTSLRATAATLLIASALAACEASGPTAEPTRAAPSSKPGSGILDMDGLATGKPPQIAFSRGRLLNGNASKEVLPDNLDQFAETKHLLVIRDVDGNVYAYSPDGPIGTTPIGQATGGLAVNDERNLVAWIAPGGAPTVLQEGEAKPAVLPAPAGVDAGDAVAIRGHDCFNSPETVEGAGCAVYFRTHDEKPTTFVASNHGFVEPDGNPIRYLTDADDAGEVGWTRVIDDLRTCSTYIGYGEGESTGPTWDTCAHLPLSFSPDGKHLLATGPVGFEGAGAGEIAFLDRADGKPLWSVRNSPQSQVFITDMAWEDNDHALASVNDGKNAAILRVGLDGTMELAAKPFPMDEDRANPLPFRLSVQP